MEEGCRVKGVRGGGGCDAERGTKRGGRYRARWVPLVAKGVHGGEGMQRKAGCSAKGGAGRPSGRGGATGKWGWSRKRGSAGAGG